MKIKLAWLLLVLSMDLPLVLGIFAHAVTAPDTQPAWTAPRSMASRKIAAGATPADQPTFLSNMDCTTITYRMVNSAAMRTGCFTSAAFGLIDTDYDVVIFNGTDEGLPLHPSSAHEVLVPWLHALDLLTLDAADTGGSYVNMYRNPLTVLKDQRDYVGQLVAKQLTAPPETPLRFSNGQRVIINPQTMAFSDNGSWLVAETTSGSFIRINLASLVILPFAPAFTIAGSPALLKSQVAVSSDGRYVAIENDAASSFKVYDLATCPANALDTSKGKCQSFDYWPFLGWQIPGLQYVRHVRFVNEGLVSFETISGSSADRYELAPTDSITALTNYLGLGDSYTSGEGAFDYLTGTDTPDNMCHLSIHSYPLLLSQDLFGAAGGHSVACSGAVIEDIESESKDYHGQVRNGSSLEELEENQSALLQSIQTNFLPGYVAQQAFVKQYQPSLVTVSIGGNDIGFGDILQNCVEPHISLRLSDNTCYSTYEDRLELTQLIDRTVPRWTALYKQLQAEAPESRLYAIGYPEIAADNGNCALNVQLNKNELTFATELIHYLNNAIQAAAGVAHVPYVDISQALAGHRLCEAASYDIAVNGLTAGTDSGLSGIGPLGKESYHPTALGHQLIEAAILRQTHNFQGLTASSPAPNDPTNLLQAPKTGRPINIVIPAQITDRLLPRGVPVSARLSGSANGLIPNSTYLVKLDGASGETIATIASNNADDLSSNFSLPSAETTGGHRLDITGQNQAGEPIDVTQPIYIAADDNDFDGDGITNTQDSCPEAINSGQDSDHDGIDDVCDNIIGETPANNPTNSQEQGSAPEEVAGIVIAPPDPNPPSDNDSSATSVLQAATTIPSEEKTSYIATAVVSSPPQHVFNAKVVLARPLSNTVLLGTQTITPLVHQRPSKPKAPSVTAKKGLRLMVLAPLVALFMWLSPPRRRPTHPNSQRRTKVFTVRQPFLYNRCMILRRAGVFLLSLLLFVCLIGASLSTGLYSAFAHPAKLEKWLNDSHFYDRTVSTIIEQASKTNDSNGQTVQIPLNDPHVQAIARSTFSSQLLSQNVDHVFNSNYAWLQGRARTPDFTIDLSGAKQDFAQKAGQYTGTYLVSLPACSAAQLAQLQSQPTPNPLNLPCLPPTTDPQAEAQQITQQLADSNDFLSNPTIAASSLSIQDGNAGQPYYQQFSRAPEIYRAGLKLPWATAILALLSAAGLFFLARTRRRGIRIIAIVSAAAGVILVALKFGLDQVFATVTRHITSGTQSTPLQQALVDFAHKIEGQIAAVNLWFGVGFIVLGLSLLGILLYGKRRAKSVTSAPLPQRPLNRPVATVPSPPVSALSARPKPKRPRLIQ